MDKYLCERCGKELVFRCAYSRIDHKLICVECDDKEQPKELAKKIAELEARLIEKDKEIEESDDEWREICDGKLETINRLIEEKHELEEIIKNKSHNKWLKAEAEKYKNEYQSLKSYIDQLKQQLKEKDKVIENLRIDLKDWQELEKKLGTKYDKVVEQLKEERKKVVQEIREPIIKSLENGVVRKNPKSSNTNLRDIILFQMLDILDQIERGSYE